MAVLAVSNLIAILCDADEQTLVEDRYSASTRQYATIEDLERIYEEEDDRDE